MRKNVKRFTGAALAATMVLSMGSLVALADETSTVSVTISNKGDGEKHTYAAYQIFSATITTETNGSETLSNIEWGSGVDGTGLLTALQQKEAFKNCGSAADVAGVIATMTNDSTDLKDVAQIVSKYLVADEKIRSKDNVISSLNAGYYLIQDDAAVTGTAAKTQYILKVVSSNIEIDPKSAVPTLEKKVYEGDYTANDTSTGGYTYGTGYNDVADYSIGEEISFQLYGTVASNYDSYDGYYYQFKDTLGEGLSYVTDDDDNLELSVKIGETTIAPEDYSVELDETTNSFTVTFANLQDIKKDNTAVVTKDSVVVVEYKAQLNEKAEIGNPGNLNTASLVFANNPNTVSFGTNKDDGTVTPPAETGETPKDQVVVLTYELDVTKVDASDNTKVLSDVKFQLKKGDKYVVVDNGKVTGFTSDSTKASTLTTDSDGKIQIAGLEDGTYTLVETKAKTGYNVIDPVELVITAVTKNGQTWTSATKPLTSITLTKNGETATDGENGVVSTTIANAKGSTLPSTGGMGTTVFYVVGILLMAGAAVVLVAKKKTSAEA